MFLDKALLNSHMLDYSVLVNLAQEVGMETLETLMQLFIAELTTLNERLTDAINQSDINEIQAVLHILKNSAGLFGAVPLATLVEQLHGTQLLSTTQQLASARVIQHNIETSRNVYLQLVTRI